MEVTELPIASIVVEDRARKDLGDLDGLAISIKMHGIIQPITINQFKRLVAGERRLAAAKLAGLTSVPCLIRNTKGIIDKKKIELAENVHRKDMTWQERNFLVLDIHNKLLEEEGSKWTHEKTADVVALSRPEVTKSLMLADAMELIPEIKGAKDEVTAQKALSMLAENDIRQELHRRLKAEISADGIAGQEADRVSRFYQVGDALEGMAGLAPDLFDFAEVDPPYGVKLEGHKNQGVGQKSAMSDYREITPKDYRNFLKRLATELFRVMKEHTYAVVWYGFEWHGAVKAELEAAGFRVTAVPAIWLKSLTTGMASQPDITLSQCYEQFLVARKGEPKLGKPGRGNVFDYRPVPSGQKLHPTEKPIELVKDIIDTFTIAPGSNIICPFLGSGVTILGAIERGHTALGWDLSANFKQRFEERVLEWQEARKPADIHKEQLARLKDEVEEEMKK